MKKECPFYGQKYANVVEFHGVQGDIQLISIPKVGYNLLYPYPNEPSKHIVK